MVTDVQWSQISEMCEAYAGPYAFVAFSTAKQSMVNICASITGGIVQTQQTLGQFHPTGHKT